MVKSIILTLCLLSISVSLFAQNVQGIVKDGVSKLPLANAQLITTKLTVLTNEEGRFTLQNVKLGDRLAVRLMGYETTEFVLQNLNDTIQIYLKQSTISLNEVTIKTYRNYKLDSLSLRKEYTNAFTYKGPSFSDLFITRNPNYNSPFGFTNPKSTASLVSLNVLQLFSFLGQKNAQNTRLKKTLLRDEELNYSDHVFSKEKVGSITGLEEEELTKFMNQYRPSVLSLKKMTGYELTLYIKKCYQEFIKVKQ